MKKFNQKREKRFPFANRFLTGLIIALALSLTAFEWTTVKMEYEIPICEGCFTGPTLDDELIMPPIKIKQEKLEIPEPPKKEKPITDKIKLVDDTPEKTTEVDDPVKKEQPVEDLTHLTNVNNNQYGGEEIPELIDENIPFTKVEVFAHYDACAAYTGEELQKCSELAIANTIKKIFKISDQLRDIGGRQGAEMTFVIDKNGEIHSIEALQSSSKAITRDAIKAIERLPKMNPAQQQGKAVALRVKIPIVVKID